MSKGARLPSGASITLAASAARGNTNKHCGVCNDQKRAKLDNDDSAPGAKALK